MSLTRERLRRANPKVGAVRPGVAGRSEGEPNLETRADVSPCLAAHKGAHVQTKTAEYTEPARNPGPSSTGRARCSPTAATKRHSTGSRSRATAAAAPAVRASAGRVRGRDPALAAAAVGGRRVGGPIRRERCRRAISPICSRRPRTSSSTSPDEALALLEDVEHPTDPWFPCSMTSARIVHAHVRYLDGDTDGAREEVLRAFADDPFAPDVWDAFARLCAETDFDPTDVVARVPDERALEVLAALRTSEAPASTASPS